MSVVLHLVRSLPSVVGLMFSCFALTCSGTNVVLNEAMANNRSTIANGGQYPDWVELFNPTSAAQDLSGLGLTDKLTIPNRFVFPPNTLVQPGGFLVVWCDSNTNAPGLHTRFNLDTGGQMLALFASPGTSPVLLDAITFGPQASDLSIGRVPDGTGSWQLNAPTPQATNRSQSLGSASALKINEWMDNPSNGSDWFEVYNPENLPVRLSDLYLSGTVSNPTNTLIPPLSFIAAKGYTQFLADDRGTNGANHVNFKISAAGDFIGVFDSNHNPIDTVTFGPQTANVSQGRYPDGSTQILSFPYSPSPGEPNYLVPAIVINEVLSHSGVQDFPPTEDAIELFNPGSSGVDMSGWFLSDSATVPKKFRIPNGTTITAGGYKMFYEYEFNPTPGTPPSFAIDSHGDALYLSSASTNGLLTGYQTNAMFGAQHHGISLGRHTTSLGVDFVAMSRRTFGSDDAATIEAFRSGTGLPNAYPKVGPVVINEIMYHPLLGTNMVDNTIDEYIELYNVSSSAVPLYDLLAPTNTWRMSNAVDYVFPIHVTLPANSYLLVVSFDPTTSAGTLADFQAKYAVPPNIQIFGPYAHKLGNTGDTVELFEPDEPDPGFIPYVLVERVSYSNSSPWPTNSDGKGFSLQRKVPAQYGNDPVNWIAAPATAGRLNFLDSDGDGMPDDWEITHGLDPKVNDASLDPDGDGLSNLNEYLAGTDPQDAASTLKLIPGRYDGTSFRMHFMAIAGKSYAIQYRKSATSGAWLKLIEVAPQPNATTIEITDPSAGANATRFYRAVTPSTP